MNKIIDWLSEFIIFMVNTHIERILLSFIILILGSLIINICNDYFVLYVGMFLLVFEFVLMSVNMATNVFNDWF